jgi:hypothetical protein
LLSAIYLSWYNISVNHGVKLGLSHWGRNAGWGCLRKGCWGRYLGLRQMT